jgi:hypothetical protein
MYGPSGSRSYMSHTKKAFPLHGIIDTTLWAHCDNKLSSSTVALILRTVQCTVRAYTVRTMNDR